MRQLHVQDSWASLSYRSEQDVINDLVARIQMLENRLRDLEKVIKESTEPEQRKLPETVGVS